MKSKGNQLRTRPPSSPLKTVQPTALRLRRPTGLEFTEAVAIKRAILDDCTDEFVLLQEFGLSPHLAAKKSIFAFRVSGPGSMGQGLLVQEGWQQVVDKIRAQIARKPHT
jgi:hypothetical protein